MNILMIVTWYGEKGKDFFTGNFHYEMAVAMKKKHNVALYFPFDVNLMERFTYGMEGGVLTFRSRACNSKIGKIKQMRYDFQQINKIFKPDIIHTHVASGAGLYGAYAKKIFGIPYILTEHTPIEMMDLGILRKIKINYILKNSSANIAVSNDLRDKLNAAFPTARYECIYNGVKDPYSVISKSTCVYRKVDGVNAIIMCALYSKTIKGLQFLLPAIKRINKHGKLVHLHVCGGGKYLDYFINMAKSLGIEEEVTFYGMCDKPKMYSILNQMDFAISASLYESAGVSVEEACMMGKPLVITKSGGANSLIPDDLCIKVDAGSEEAIFKGLYTMLDTYKTYNASELSKYGFANFDMEKICEKYNNLYISILSSKEKYCLEEQKT